MLTVEKVSAEIVRPLRHKVLRSDQPFEASIMPWDDHEKSFHFLVKRDEAILSVASFYHESFDALPDKRAYRLRGMATEPAKEGKGYGSMVLSAGMAYLRNDTDTEILWCNARTPAFGFYEKMGFMIVGAEFDIPKLGLHKTGYIEL